MRQAVLPEGLEDGGIDSMMTGESAYTLPLSMLSLTTNPRLSDRWEIPMSDEFEFDPDQPITIGLTIYIEYREKLGPEPERWTPQKRREFCDGLRKVVAEHDKTATVVYQGNNTPEDKLPTSVIVWLHGWQDDPDDRWKRIYTPPDPFAMRAHLRAHGYHVSTIHYGFDPVMA